MKKWIVGAGSMVALFVALHVLGWRDDTRIISGTAAGPGLDSALTALRGVLYALAYFGAVILAPILIIAAGLLAGFSRLVGRRPAEPGS